MSPLEFLKSCDPVLGGAIDSVGPLEEHGASGDHFAALCHIILGQQLSVASARAIRGRFEAHFGEKPDAAKVVQLSAEDAKTLGLSGAKARYVRDLAAHICDGKLEIARLELLSDDKIREELVAVKGIGPWSVDMFLMFHLQKPDVLPVGDLGIREAFKRLYDLEERPDAAKMEELSALWRPHRTLACRYLWRFLDLPAGS